MFLGQISSYPTKKIGVKDALPYKRAWPFFRRAVAFPRLLRP